MVEKQGVARATLREALRLLEFQGALRIKAGPGGGPVVSVPGIDHLASALSLQLQFSNASFRSVLEARRAIYPILVAEAAQNASHQDIAALRQNLAEVRAAIGLSGSAVAEMRRFYELIAVASQNLVLGMLVNALHRMSEPINTEYDATRWQASLRESESLLNAIERSDAEEARAISTRATAAAMRYQEKNAPEQLNAPVCWIATD
jgi:DNA-binding FadR family transcriptional regulator